LIGIPSSINQQTPEQKELLRKLIAAFKNPRINKAEDESVLKTIYGIMSLLMNSEMKCDRVKLFLNEKDKHCFGSSNPRDSVIKDLNFRGKAKLHMSCLADTLTIAQEAWILLHLARCYYYHFEANICHEDLPVTSQALQPGQGNSQSYSQKDVNYFRILYKKIQTARKLEEQCLEDGTIEKDACYCHWEYGEAFDEYNRELHRNGEDEVAAREDPDPLDGIPDDIDDDSLDGVEDFEI